MQGCAISELALHGEWMTKTKVQLCDRNLSGVNDTVSEVQAWVNTGGSSWGGTDTGVTGLLVGRLPSTPPLYRSRPSQTEKAWRQSQQDLGGDIDVGLSD